MEKGNGGAREERGPLFAAFSTSALNAVCCSQPVRPFSQTALLRHHLYPTGKFLGRYCHSHLALANTVRFERFICGNLQSTFPFIAGDLEDLAKT